MKGRERKCYKKYYSSEEQARAVLSFECEEYGYKKAYVYLCPECGGWHGSHKKQSGALGRVTSDSVLDKKDSRRFKTYDKSRSTTESGS